MRDITGWILVTLGIICCAISANIYSNTPRPSLHIERICSVDSDNLRAKFIIDCASAANPHSDEEGEDLVSECGRQAERLYCTEGRMFIQSLNGSAVQPCRWARTPEQKAVCGINP